MEREALELFRQIQRLTTEFIERWELQILRQEAEEALSNTAINSPLSSRPHTPEGPRPLSPRPDWSQPDPDSIPAPRYAQQWITRRGPEGRILGGTVHRHQGQVRIGVCPNCVHINNVNSLTCRHTCHQSQPDNQQPRSAHWCPWCAQPVWTTERPDPRTPGSRQRR